jgi:hypothetical protein
MSQSGRTEKLLHRLSGRDRVSDQLGTGRVACIISPKDTGNSQAQLIFTFLVNMLARLHPVVRELDVYIAHDAPLRVHVPRWSARTLHHTVDNFIHALRSPTNCRVLSTEFAGEYDVAVLVGHSDSILADVFVGSHGWVAEISPDHPVTVVDSPNPVGAYSAAALGAAEVFKRLLVPFSDLFPGIPIVPIDSDLTFSTFDYSCDADAPNPGLPDQIDIGTLTVVGVGAGGGACVYTLASVMNLIADFLFIDPDEQTDTGLNRAVCACEPDTLSARKKVHVAADVVHSTTTATARVLDRPFDEVISELGPDDLRHVVAAVHSRAARRSIQSETPQYVWDAAATDTGEFYVWSVEFGLTECLACRFSDDGTDPEREKARQLEQLVGLSQEVWFRKILNNEPFTVDEVESMQQRTPDAPYDFPFRAQRFDDWHAERCGKLKLADPDDEIPIPFAPVLAGVLLAGEVIKHKLYPSVRLASRYWNTLLGQFMRSAPPQQPSRRRNCPICAEPAFAGQFYRRWQSAAAVAK